MSHRIMRTALTTAACLLIFGSTAFAGGQFSKTGKSGQVYTWAAGHC